MFIPLGKPIQDNLVTSYVLLESLVEDLAQGGFSGLVEVVLRETVGYIVLDAGTVAGALERRGRVVDRSDVAQIDAQARLERGRITVYAYSRAAAGLVAERINARPFYTALSTQYTDPQRLISKLAHETDREWFIEIIAETGLAVLIHLRDARCRVITSGEDSDVEEFDVAELSNNAALARVLDECRRLGGTFDVWFTRHSEPRIDDPSAIQEKAEFDSGAVAELASEGVTAEQPAETYEVASAEAPAVEVGPVEDGCEPSLVTFEAADAATPPLEDSQVQDARVLPFETYQAVNAEATAFDVGRIEGAREPGREIDAVVNAEGQLVDVGQAEDVREPSHETDEIANAWAQSVEDDHVEGRVEPPFPKEHALRTVEAPPEIVQTEGASAEPQREMYGIDDDAEPEIEEKQEASAIRPATADFDEVIKPVLAMSRLTDFADASSESCEPESQEANPKSEERDNAALAALAEDLRAVVASEHPGEADDPDESADIEAMSEVKRMMAEIARTIEAAAQSVGRPERFSMCLRAGQIKVADSYPFLDPFAGEFEYLAGEIVFVGEATTEEFVAGFSEALTHAVRGVTQATAYPDRFRAYVSEDLKKLLARNAAPFESYCLDQVIDRLIELR